MKHSCLVLALIASSAHANDLIAPGSHKVGAESAFVTETAGEWNRLSRKDGAHVEVWTRDGESLNQVSFFSAVPLGKAIYAERNRKAMPLPKVAANMLLPDIPLLFESTYRAQYKVNQMSIDSQDVTTISGRQAIRFTYSYMRGEDEVQRKGEAVGAIVDKKLYLVTYEAPGIYFYDKDYAEFDHIVKTLKF